MTKTEDDSDMRDEYDFSAGIRGKYVQRLAGFYTDTLVSKVLSWSTKWMWSLPKRLIPGPCYANKTGYG